jgi:myo-inositol 2-dehydrogenase / D-chiro-inositol 1-dehydrogenase
VTTGEFTRVGSSAWDGYAAAVVAEAGARALASGTKLSVEMIAKPEFYA